MVADDFSFPVVQTPLNSHHFSVDPTSFWCVSPQSFPGYSHAGAEDRGRRSEGCCSLREGEGEKEEEKMDMLWEDFNEDLKRAPSKKEGGGRETPQPAVVEVCCVRAVEMSPRRTNGGGGVVSHRSQSVVVVGLKVLKKMFLLHNSARFIRRRKPDRCYLNR